MRRKIDGKLLEGLSDELNKATEKQWQTYQCTLVTPMYGGGVKAGEVDTEMSIRASSIRGQLRFWWRIACGPFDSPKEMFDRETAIWGGIGDDGATASQVEIRVQNIESKGDVKAFEYKLNKAQKYTPFPDPDFGHAYILFSAKGELAAGGKAVVKEAKKVAKPKLAFDLNIHFKIEGDLALTPEQLGEVKEAIRWWASFGGIGGRTRRGLGAVEVKLNDVNLPPVTRDEVEVKGGVLTLVSPNDNKDVIGCWKYGCDKLRDFRQGKKVGRNEGSSDPKRPGRSRWPEPDQLRRMAKKHKTNHAPEHPAGNSFPRSAFGMPIIFDFNDRSKKEPDTMALLPKGEQRMASPLVLRPYFDGATWQAAALLLPSWQEALMQELVLDPKPQEQPQHWSSDPNHRQSLAKQISPMKKKDGSLRADDPLSAFLDYFEKGQ